MATAETYREATARHRAERAEFQVRRLREQLADAEMRAKAALDCATAFTEPETRATEAEIELARDQRGDAHLMIDDDALASRDDGVLWVQAWVRVELES